MKTKTEVQMKTEVQKKSRTEVQKKSRTETRIKKALLSLHKAVMAYYEKHPEAQGDVTREIACYGDAVVGVRDFNDGKGIRGIASITLHTVKGGHRDIAASIHLKELKTWKQN